MVGDVSSRRFKRVTVDLWVSHESVGSFRADRIANISEGGIFIQTKRPLPLDTTIYMDIHITNGELIHAVGQVVWHRDRKSNPEEPMGMGVNFIHIDEETQKKLTEFITQEENI